MWDFLFGLGKRVTVWIRIHAFFPLPTRDAQRKQHFETHEGFTVSWGGGIMGLFDCGNRLGWLLSSLEAHSKPKANRSRLQPVIASTCSRFAPHPSRILSSVLTLNLLRAVWMWFSENNFWEIALRVFNILLLKMGLWPKWIVTSNVFDMCFMSVSVNHPSLFILFVSRHSIWSQWIEIIIETTEWVRKWIKMSLDWLHKWIHLTITIRK